MATGASRGIGAAVAATLAQHGFYVTVHYRCDEPGARQTLLGIENGDLLQFDVANRQESREKLEQYIEEYGAFYGVVCNAGIARDCSFPMMTDEDWSEVLKTNLDSFFNVVHPCIVPMISLRQGGRIVVVSSVAGLAGNRGQVNYSASKAGLIGAAKDLALKLAGYKITVNCVAPGLIDTSMEKLEENLLKKNLEVIPLKRMETPSEVASLVGYLMSDAASYITRQVISVNGGLI